MISLPSTPNQINLSSSQSRQNRFSPSQKIQFLSFLTFREKEERPENLSNYAKRYACSRQTLYNIKNKFFSIFSPQKTGPKPTSIPFPSLDSLPSPELPFPPFHKILGKSVKTLSPSLQLRIHRTLLELAVSPNSAKKIRAILRQAFSLDISKRKIKALINAYSLKAKTFLQNLHLEKFVQFLAIDEIFCGKLPVLTGIELDSFAVVFIERSLKRDSQAWSGILDSFESLKLIVSDEGSGLTKAVKKLEEKGVKHQFDLFHFKREASKILRHIESQAYKKIEQEYYWKERRFSKGGYNEELWDKYIRHKGEALKAITLFDLVEKNLNVIFECLEPFDSQGKLLDPSSSLSKLKKASENLKKASKNKKIQNLAKKASNEKMLHYLTELNEKLLSTILRWNPGVKRFTRKEVFEIIGHFYHEKSKKIKVFQRKEETRKELLERRKEMVRKHYNARFVNGVKLSVLKKSLSNFDEVFNSVMKSFSEIYRASSLVESYNSQIRIEQQVKKSVHGDYFWLCALKWNATAFEGGKRKGKSPLEILGIEQKGKDWLDLLLEEA